LGEGNFKITKKKFRNEKKKMISFFLKQKIFFLTFFLFVCFFWAPQFLNTLPHDTQNKIIPTFYTYFKNSLAEVYKGWGREKWNLKNRQIKRGKKYADNTFLLYPRGLGVCDQMMMVNFFFVSLF
jgi:hypothetical protein